LARPTTVSTETIEELHDKGMSVREIAEELHVAPITVRRHLAESASLPPKGVRIYSLDEEGADAAMEAESLRRWQADNKSNSLEIDDEDDLSDREPLFIGEPYGDALMLVEIVVIGHNWRGLVQMDVNTAKTGIPWRLVVCQPGGENGKDFKDSYRYTTLNDALRVAKGLQPKLEAV
jgi:post-segregation antitoxin (ccd killing protein)